MKDIFNFKCFVIIEISAYAKSFHPKGTHSNNDQNQHFEGHFNIIALGPKSKQLSYA